MGDIFDALKHRRYFFDHGICFECQKCGACCTGEPGHIYVDDQEVRRIARFLDISRDVFVDRYLYPFRDSYSIASRHDGRCVFLENGCMIHPVRPTQCRTFPFWFQNLRSEDNWRDVCNRCPGIGKGPRYHKEEIFELIDLTFDQSNGYSSSHKM